MKTFKELLDSLNSDIGKESCVNEELFSEFEESKELIGELESQVKPNSRLTLRGFIKVCPICGSELSKYLVRKRYTEYGWFYEYLYKCHTTYDSINGEKCGYKFPITIIKR